MPELRSGACHSPQEALNLADEPNIEKRSPQKSNRKPCATTTDRPETRTRAAAKKALPSSPISTRAAAKVTSALHKELSSTPVHTDFKESKASALRITRSKGKKKQEKEKEKTQ